MRVVRVSAAVHSPARRGGSAILLPARRGAEVVRGCMMSVCSVCVCAVSITVHAPDTVSVSAVRVSPREHEARVNASEM
jgi:hypothetical protein